MADSTEPGATGRTGQAPALRLRFAAVSDVGRHRKENQDSGYASGRLLAVADGVGGAAYGDVASSTAIQLLRRLDEAGPSGDDMLPLLAGAVHRVHDRLAEMVEQDRELDGTSTTVTAALFDGRQLGMAHVGDSRAYLLRGGAMRQLTADHTFVQTLIDEGRITEDEARVHPHRNIILRAVDGVHDTEPDLFHVDLEPGDRVLLCSDGLPAGAADAEIARLLAEGTVDSAAVVLVQAALDGGSTDNVTVVVAEAVDAGSGGPVDDAETSAAAATGPMLVGAAAAQPRKGGGAVGMGRGLFRRQHDTDEIEPVPAGPDDGEPVDPEELRYAPRAPRRFVGLRRVLVVLLPLLLLVGAAAGGYAWTRSQYYVGADGEQVAVYRGVEMELPGIDLSSVYETSDLTVGDLSTFDQQTIEDGIPARDLDAARRIVANLEEQAACEEQAREAEAQRQAEREAAAREERRADADRQQRTTDDPSDDPSDGPTAGPSDGPTDGASPSADPSPSDSPSSDSTGSDSSTTDSALDCSGSGS